MISIGSRLWQGRVVIDWECEICGNILTSPPSEPLQECKVCSEWKLSKLCDCPHCDAEAGRRGGKNTEGSLVYYTGCFQEYCPEHLYVCRSVSHHCSLFDKQNQRKERFYVDAEWNETVKTELRKRVGIVGETGDPKNDKT